MKKMFCPGCDDFTPVGVFSWQDLDCEIVLKANRLISTGKASEEKGGLVDLDPASKVEVNTLLSEVILTDNEDSTVVCPKCREGVLFTNEDLSEEPPRVPKEDKLRRADFKPEIPGALGALTPDFVRKHIQSLDGLIKDEKTLTKDSITTSFNVSRYYISVDQGKVWKEVSLSSYASAERKAGHLPEAMKGPIATKSFEQDGVMGKVVEPKVTK